MKPIWLTGAAGVILLALVVCSSDSVGQDPGKKGPFPGKGAPFKGKGFGGPGFERPLAAEPRRGNPGASPNLSDADFRDIVSHARDFDANKDGKLSRGEVPEMFGSLFDRADLNRDGVLDQDEMNRVLAPAASKAQVAAPSKAPKSP